MQLLTASSIREIREKISAEGIREDARALLVHLISREGQEVNIQELSEMLDRWAERIPVFLIVELGKSKRHSHVVRWPAQKFIDAILEKGEAMRFSLHGQLSIEGPAMNTDVELHSRNLAVEARPEGCNEPTTKNRSACDTVNRWLSENVGIALSPRERDVLQLLLEGKSNKEIARLLGLSVGTIKNYVSTLLRVANAKTRVGIMAALTRSNPP